MITKLIFTLLVIIAVGLIFRAKTEANKSKINDENDSPDQPSTLSMRVVTYLIIGILLLISGVLFVFNYQADHKIVNIEVLSKEGTRTLYQAKQKEIKGRNFITVDGKKVSLGENDRVEIDEN